MLLYRVHAGHFDTFEPYYLYSGSSDWREYYGGKSSKFENNFSVDTYELILLDFQSIQKVKFFIKNFFGKSDEISCSLQIWSHLRQKSLMENLHLIVISIPYREIVTLLFLSRKT